MKTTSAHRPTQKDVALHCGVSQMAVSLALRGSLKVSASVRRKILRAAKQLGWKPDPTLSALVSYRHRSVEKKNFSTIAWITAPFDDNKDSGLVSSNETYRQGAIARAKSLGYLVEEFRLNEDGMTSSRLGQILYSRNIRGLIMTPRPASRVPVQLSWEHFAVVTCGYASTQPCFNMATLHHFHAAALAFRELRSLGYRRIGVLLQQRSDAGADSGLLEGCLKEQRRFSSGDVAPVTSLPELTLSALRQYLTRYKPDALLTNLDNVVDHFRHLGIATPRDLGLAHLCGADNESGISGVNQNAFAVGEVALELVATMIQRNEFGIPASPRCIMLDGFWVKGRTLRQVNKKAKPLEPTDASFQYWTEWLRTGTS